VDRRGLLPTGPDAPLCLGGCSGRKSVVPDAARAPRPRREPLVEQRRRRDRSAGALRMPSARQSTPRTASAVPRRRILVGYRRSVHS
jgi:hypothetical protein